MRFASNFSHPRRDAASEAARRGLIGLSLLGVVLFVQLAGWIGLLHG